MSRRGALDTSFARMPGGVIARLCHPTRVSQFGCGGTPRRASALCAALNEHPRADTSALRADTPAAATVLVDSPTRRREEVRRATILPLTDRREASPTTPRRRVRHPAAAPAPAWAAGSWSKSTAEPGDQDTMAATDRILIIGAGQAGGREGTGRRRQETQGPGRGTRGRLRLTEATCSAQTPSSECPAVS